jgi:hypothetical protein
VQIILDRFKNREWDTNVEEVEIKGPTSRVSPFSSKNYTSAPSMRFGSQLNFEQMCHQMQKTQQKQR